MSMALNDGEGRKQQPRRKPTLLAALEVGSISAAFLFVGLFVAGVF